MEVWWPGGQVKLASAVFVSDNSSQKQLKNLRLQDEQNNRQYQVNDVVDLMHEHFAPPIGQVIF